MAEISESNAVSVLNFNDEPNDQNPPPSSAITKDSHMFFSTPFIQKLLAEVLGTYFLIFAGCASVVVNVNNDKVVSLPGISMVWGLAVTVLVYSLGHISGAHFNPAVTIAFATCKRFPLKQVPFYIVAQAIGSTMAAVTLRLLFSCLHDVFAGTSPQGSGLQAFVIEFITTFYLMFVVSGVATDDRAIGEFAGLAVGSIVVLNVLFAGQITGASMNPARSLGPAIVWNRYKGIWIYLTSPIVGAVSGAWVYNMLRFTNKPLPRITKAASFLKTSCNCD
ncbi:aquaporin NIP1-2-like [Hibiscus syriacus]|uniref:aquaporin NIP1-2-like n=1 Tax=Hibiscus syriacus TaxID=106335 RepID=UPI0019228A71|nr:aquaporin NIP1-2-like [Hibiscus syriacus]